MSRYSLTLQSPSGSSMAAETAFANIVAGSSANFRLVRFAIGCQVASTITNQQTSVYLTRATARGTVSTTLTGLPSDPRSRASAIAGVDTAWSAAPTIAQTTLPGALWGQSFNLQSNYEEVVENDEGWVCDQGTVNGLCFVNGANALPTGYVYTLTVWWVE